MFVVLLDYVADLAKVDALIEDHVEWLGRHYEAGLFLVSGRQEPRTGGVILAAGERTAVQEAIAADPFALAGVARHTIVEFLPSTFGGVLDDEAIRTALS